MSRNSGHRSRRRRRNKRAALKNSKSNVTRSQRRNRRKATLESRLLNDTRLGSTDKAIYLNFATTVSACFEHPDMLKGVEEFLDSGRITSFIIASPGLWSPDTCNRLKEMMEDRGFAWAWNHVVFPLDTETTSKFFERIIKVFEISHYVDTKRENLLSILYAKRNDNVRLFHMSEGESITHGWKDVREWLKKTAPAYWKLEEPGDAHFDIISTGVASEQYSEEDNVEELPHLTEKEMEWLFESARSKSV